MLLVNIGCIIAFLVQISLITYDYLLPDQTITDTYRQELDQIEFPVNFKICVIPGFNDSMLRQEGYPDTPGFFHGKSHFNGSIFGWGGHYENTEKRKSSKGNICLI